MVITLGPTVCKLMFGRTRNEKSTKTGLETFKVGKHLSPQLKCFMSYLWGIANIAT